MTFDYAARVFRDQNRLDKRDNRKDYNEERRIVHGEIEDRLYVVCYVRRGEDIHRLISARKANKREQRDHYGNR